MKEYTFKCKKGDIDSQLGRALESLKNRDWLVFVDGEGDIQAVIKESVLELFSLRERTRFLCEGLYCNWGGRCDSMPGFRARWKDNDGLTAKEEALKLERLIAEASEPQIEHTVYHSE